MAGRFAVRAVAGLAVLAVAVVVPAVPAAAQAAAGGQGAGAPAGQRGPTRLAVQAGPGAAARHWVTGWSASSTTAARDASGCPAFSGLHDQTVRTVTTVSAGGSEVRIDVTNRFGTVPLHVGRATVAVRGEAADAVPGTMRQLTFHGHREATIPAGASMRSDPVDLAVPALQQLAVSVYLPDATGPVTQHPWGRSGAYLASGDRAGDPAATGYQVSSCSMFTDRVELRATGRAAGPAASGAMGPAAGRAMGPAASRAMGPAASRAMGTVVTLGDSITDGTTSVRGTIFSWPDELAQRLAGRPGRTLSVANAGISGNEVLVDRIPVQYGESALHRLDRDVFRVTGVRTMILLEGINDIGADSATAAQLIAADRRIVAAAHARGIRVVGATLTPFAGSTTKFGGDYGTAYGDAQRRALNDWIRTGGAFDAVVDFDRVVADPADPSRMLPAYDSGDHLHPGTAGYQAMGDAIDLSELT
ncbi:SGNH/GDSL hydrolase family protein [Actinocatenispora sera]|uniref:SGNH/GDSL hydrolase family protein n=1 Tax=Actinocatenispora sera TaxID=390989 RepID=UPI00340258DA